MNQISPEKAQIEEQIHETKTFFNQSTSKHFNPLEIGTFLTKKSLKFLYIYHKKSYPKTRRSNKYGHKYSKTAQPLFKTKGRNRFTSSLYKKNTHFHSIYPLRKLVHISQKLHAKLRI